VGNAPRIFHSNPQTKSVKMKIFLLEDDCMLNDTITDYFKSKGDDVVSLDDGEKAIEVIDASEFDLYIMAPRRNPWNCP
jgi:CheY-like chemotaxis protein